MELLNKEILQELLATNEAPCISLYMPTHRSHPKKLQDVIRFKDRKSTRLNSSHT